MFETIHIGKLEKHSTHIYENHFSSSSHLNSDINFSDRTFFFTCLDAMIFPIRWKMLEWKTILTKFSFFTHILIYRKTFNLSKKKKKLNENQQKKKSDFKLRNKWLSTNSWRSTNDYDIKKKLFRKMAKLFFFFFYFFFFLIFVQYCWTHALWFNTHLFMWMCWEWNGKRDVDCFWLDIILYVRQKFNYLILIIIYYILYYVV